MQGPVGGAQANVQVEWENYDAYRIADERNEMVLGSFGAIEHYGTYQENGVTAVNATCGATFISPHFAVTAGHCVVNVGDGVFIDESEFYVEQIDVSAVSPADRQALAEVTGRAGGKTGKRGRASTRPLGINHSVTCAGSSVATLEDRSGAGPAARMAASQRSTTP
jgi:hypothetical protein